MYYFGFNNKISVSLKPFMMSRVVDVKYVLEKLAKDMILDLSIRINDGILSQNNQVFHIKMAQYQFLIIKLMQQWI